jgi:hypothetical protein
MSTVPLTIFRSNIIQALRVASSDEELRKELHRLINQEVNKEIPYIVRPVKTVEKTIH